MIKKDMARFGVMIASKELGLDDVDVEFRGGSFFPNEIINAMFIQETYTIVFNIDLLKYGTVDQILKCAFHEVRHAYQKACVEFPEFMDIDVSKEEVNRWKQEFDNYLDFITKGHTEQMIEIDAIRYAEDLFYRLYEK